MSEGLYQSLLRYGLRIADEGRVALGMLDHTPHPCSITEDEFNFIRDYVAARGCRSGYELGTGFGISACAIGLGLRPSGGRLVSMDCYAEEVVNLAGEYPRHPAVNPRSDGYRIAGELLRHFGLTETVTLRVGVSPEDAPKGPFDFVFLDGSHFDECLALDVDAIKRELMPRCTVMVHDLRCFYWGVGALAEQLGCKMVTADLPRTFGLGYFERG